MTVEITAEMVKELRHRTGIGIGKCKEALSEAKGDMELAIANLRKAGLASAVKKAGRETNEGIVAAAKEGDTIAVVEVNAETDFVVKNERFQEFAQEIAQEAAKSHPETVEAFCAQSYSKDPSQTIEQMRAELVQGLGENIQIRRVHLVDGSGESSVGVYSHMGGKILCVCQLSGAKGEEELAREIAMHIAAEAPDYLNPEEIPEEERKKEEEIAREQVKGKPENIMDKIVAGKLRAWYDQVCLLNQKFVKDPDMTIEKLVEKRGKEAGKPLAVKAFLRWQVGQ
jgi:elongation factor Ts